MLDYTQVKKKYLDVKLIDGTVLYIGVPKRALYMKLIGLEETLNNNGNYNEMYDELLSLTAEILSNNKEGMPYTAKDVDGIMDIADMSLIITEYSKFAVAIRNDPN